MRKLFSIAIIMVFVLLLTSCKGSESIYKFKERKDDFFISEDGYVLIDYKTDGNGELVELNVDRLLTIEDMIFYNPLIDFNYELEGFTGDIFTDPGFYCTSYNDMDVPINIEIGSTRFKYDKNDCEYQEVDRNNEIKSGSYSRKYRLNGTIDVSKETLINITVYNPDSLEKFIDVFDLPHTVKLLGVYSILINDDLDGFDSRTTNYFNDIGIFEQLVLKHQENEMAVNEVIGLSMDINLLDFDEMAEVIPLVANFEEDYASEIEAINEMVILIGAINTVDAPIDEENPDDEEDPVDDE